MSVARPPLPPRRSLPPPPPPRIAGTSARIGASESPPPRLPRRTISANTNTYEDESEATPIPPPLPRRAVSVNAYTPADNEPEKSLVEPLSPPLLPRNASTKIGQDELPSGGIAARIAGLQLNHVGRPKVPLGKPPPIPRLRKEKDPEEPKYHEPEPEPHSEDEPEPVVAHQAPAPPPIPPKWTRPSPDELARALARRPPPPPVAFPIYAEPNPPTSPREAGPPRRLIPPMPSSLPTPPPEPQPEPYEETDDQPYYEAVPYDGSTSCLQCRDFSHVDAHAAQFPRHTVTSLDNLAYDLTEPFPYETEKARAIFTWMHHNIAYDAESFLSGKIQAATAESTLTSGLAVCDGYAGLFKSLAERVGMETHRVVGHGKGVGYVTTGPGESVPPYSSGHAWNCVHMDGEWRLIDACWGAGALNGRVYEPRFTPTWFTSGPAEFGRRHFPEDPSYQLMSEEEGGAISWEEYILEPEGPTIFIDFYKLDLWQSAVQPTTNIIQGGQRIVFSIFKRCEHMSTAEADNFVYIISLADNTRVPMDLNAQGGWSAEVFIPKGSGEVSLYSVTTVDGGDAMGIGLQAFAKALGRKRMSFGGLARWTVV